MRQISEARPSGAGGRPLTAALALLSAATFAACSDGTGVGSPGTTTLAFRTSSAVATSTASALPEDPATAPLVFDATNGTLSIEAVWMIVAEAELDPVEDSCDDDGLDDDDSFAPCGDFEAGPRLVQLDLDGAPVEVFEAVVPAGVYDELEFEIEDLDDDEDDPRERAAIEALRADISAMVPDWPRDASLYVVGTFQPAGGEPEAFRVFVEAEIEIELDLVPPVVIDAEGGSSRALVVDVRPDLWFRDAQGGVLDLRLWDFDSTRRLLELELEIEDGFIEVEVED